MIVLHVNHAGEGAAEDGVQGDGAGAGASGQGEGAGGQGEGAGADVQGDGASGQGEGAGAGEQGEGAEAAALIRRAVREALRREGVRSAEISITLLGDAGIADLHERHLGRPGPTDVLSFALHDADQPALGDVYIGRDQAVRQAARLGVPTPEELARLAVHGVLHVLGHDHPEGAGREDSPMFRIQEDAVRAAAATPAATPASAAAAP